MQNVAQWTVCSFCYAALRLRLPLDLRGDSATTEAMNVFIKHKRTGLFMVALVIMPLLFGHAFHCLVPCISDFYNSNTSPLSETGPRTVCKLLAMPRDVAHHVAWDCFLDLVEHRHSHDH